MCAKDQELPINVKASSDTEFALIKKLVTRLSDNFLEQFETVELVLEDNYKFKGKYNSTGSFISIGTIKSFHKCEPVIHNKLTYDHYYITTEITIDSENYYLVVNYMVLSSITMRIINDVSDYLNK